jgi:hypothetical protein
MTMLNLFQVPRLIDACAFFLVIIIECFFAQRFEIIEGGDDAGDGYF